MVAAFCAPESACPGMGLGITASGDGIQVLGADAVTYDSRNHQDFIYDCALNGGQGGYLIPKAQRKVFTAAQRGALAGADLYAGLCVLESDTLLEYTYTGTVWIGTGNLGAWQTYTPSWTGMTSVAGSTNTGLYKRSGRQIDFQAILTLGGGDIPNALLGVSPPATAARVFQPHLSVNFHDTGTAIFPGMAIMTTTGRIDLYAQDASTATVKNLASSATVPFIFTNTDIIAVGGTYESAA